MAIVFIHCVQLGWFPVFWYFLVVLYKVSSSSNQVFFFIYISSGFPLSNMIGILLNSSVVFGKSRLVKII